MVKAPAKHTEREKHGWCFPRKNKIGCYDHSPYKNNYLDFERNVNHFQPVMSQKQIYYSDKYDDDKFEYRHVMLPKDIARRVPKTHLMSETEWRNLGVQQSQGWVHYMIHEPEPHILLFRRPRPPSASQ
ncbi:cyclin-dependent kinases regulatory subunit 1 isoform X1 [Anguilla rostrata]|uniref:cyclin-dependent kinases regulatory subunit 1 isoform X1 n=2 Tax=Anguilla anguilla TaxID=7936 RepID=UPI0015AB49D3|nr:cyclin-dependent kinases regulatory subunit 1 isoform X1 [Anguilla anguilla]